MPKHTIQAELATVSKGATVTELTIEPLPNNHLVCLQQVCVTNNDANNTRVDLCVKIGSALMVIDTIVCASDGYYYSWIGSLYFNSCKAIVLRFKNTNSGDKLEGYVYGYYLD